MKKSSLFISAILTTFVLVVMAGAFSAYRAFASSPVQVPIAQVQKTSLRVLPELTTQVQQESNPVTATTPWLTPQQGAQLAAQYLGRSDLYSVEPDFMYGVSVYKVTFTSGAVVYVSMDGQIFKVDMSAAPVVQISAQSSSSNQPVYVEHEGGSDD